MERPIDFSRDRYMLCGRCGHEWVVDLDRIDRWEQALESCPGCGVTCDVETAPRVTVDPDDPALADEDVGRLVWYHTSTRPDWPLRDFDPAAELTQETRRRMGGERQVARWVERQRAKALHVGTYEAAIHNMLRRIRDQADSERQFYLYRVRLRNAITVREGWLVDPSDFVGDVVLDEVCPPGIDVARYLNYHEDPGGLSLALGRAAIASIQQVGIPLLSSEGSGWVDTSVRELENTTVISPPPAVLLPIGGRSTPSPRSRRARDLAAPLAQRLPVNLRRQFEAAAALNDHLEPEAWARYVVGLMNLVLAPEEVLDRLDSATVRYL